MKALAGVVAACALLLAAPSSATEKEGFEFKRKPEVAQIKPKKPVRVKIKRHNDGKYTWEISGDDIEEIRKADARLRGMFEAKE